MRSNYQTPYPRLRDTPLPAIVQKVREIVERDPHFVYDPPTASDGDPTCSYEYEGQPSCLLGKAMFECGVPIEELRRMDRKETVDFNSLPIRDAICSAHGWTPEVVRSLDPDTRRYVEWLGTVQRKQDDSQEYEHCVLSADANYPLP